jgi:hypothetical protein
MAPRATIQPTKNHLERNQTDGAGQRMAGRDRRGQHSAALFSTEDEVGGRRRSEGEDWSEDHDKAWTPVVPSMPVIAGGLG